MSQIIHIIVTTEVWIITECFQPNTMIIHIDLQYGV